MLNEEILAKCKDLINTCHELYKQYQPDEDLETFTEWRLEEANQFLRGDLKDEPVS
jgi:hypothetical protein